MRGCKLWPAPEVEQLRELEPAKFPATLEREQMAEHIKGQEWRAGEPAAYARAILEGLEMASHAPPDTCPINAISPTSHRLIHHYNRLQGFGLGMGGIVPPTPNMLDADVRTLHGFNVIANEAERLRQLERTAEP